MALQFDSPSPDATRAAAALLARALPESSFVVVLTGPLGAGKTVFAKGLASGLGVDPNSVHSPTFGICSEYDTPDGRRLAHVDGYRLKNEVELEDAGFLDWLDSGTLVVIEWGDRFPAALPLDRLEIALDRSPQAPTRRRLNAVASGPAAAEVLEGWRALLTQAGERLESADESADEPADG